MVDTATTVDAVVEGNRDTAETSASIVQKPFIVGEHSVYESVEDLFKGAVQKEQFIQQLKKEKAELSAQLEQYKLDSNLKQELEKIRKETQMTDVNMEEMTKTPITDDTIKEIALKAMQEYGDKQTKEANLNECKSLLGSKEEDINLALTNKASELGVTKEDLEDMAATKPQLFKRLFEIKETSRSMDFIPSSVRAVSNNEPTDTYGEFIKNANDKRYVAAMVDKALKDPTLVSDWEWKVK